jgi:hypothetical protein
METATIERTDEAAAAGPVLERKLTETYEQQTCPQCMAVFPPGCMRSLPLTAETAMSNRRTVRAYCPHCDAGYEATVVYRDGMVVQLGHTRQIAGAAVAELVAEYDRLCGGRQVLLPDEAAPPAPSRVISAEIEDLKAKLAASREAARVLELAIAQLQQQAIPPAGGRPAWAGSPRRPTTPRPTPSSSGRSTGPPASSPRTSSRSRAGITSRSRATS